MEFKEKLQLLRTNLKLSQEELANRLGISRQSITKWENGQSFPDIQKLIQLSEIFKVSVDRLVKENEIMPSQPGSHDFCYEDGDHLYMDTYFGGQKFPCVSFHAVPGIGILPKGRLYIPVPVQGGSGMIFLLRWRNIVLHIR